MSPFSLTFNLLFTLAIKLPIVAYFFKKRKRQSAINIAMIINLTSWVISKIIWLQFAEVSPHILLEITIGMAVVEGVAYWYFLGRNWKKALLMALVTNIAAYLITTYIKMPAGLFQKKTTIIH